MSPNRGLVSTLLATAAMLVVLLAFFGCSNNDPSLPESSVGTIEIKIPTEKIDASWHLYGPGDSFRHGDTDVVLHEMPTGQYTIIWTAVKEWTAPKPAQRTLAANATLTLHGEYLDKAPKTSFVRLEPSDFIMGSDNGSRRYYVYYPEYPDSVGTAAYPPEIGRDPDEARHRVIIDYAYFMGNTEITNQEFVELGNWAIENEHATTTESSMLDALDGSTVELINFDFPDTPIDVQDGVLRLKKPEFAARPLIEVTWHGAASYCDWLSLLDGGVDRAYDHSTWALVNQSFRLPTEAEWENACRANTQTAFSSGDIQSGGCTEPALDGSGWYCGNAGGTSHDVGTKAANPAGLFDMHGNVWEWCHDYYAAYEVPDLPVDGEGLPKVVYDDEELTPVTNPFGPDEGENRVLRSGRWLLSSAMCRSASRMMGTPVYQGFHIGFRVAFPASPSK